MGDMTSELQITEVEEHRSPASDVKIFPNPGFDKLSVSIESKAKESVEITVTDQSGRKIQSTKKYCDGITPVTVDISAIPNGFYLLSVRRASGTSLGKFVVAR